MLEGGHFAYLPLGQRLLHRLQMLVRQQLELLDGQEIHAPAEPDTGLAPVLVRLVRREIDSYRQLPALLFQMSTRSIAEPRPRVGLFGAKERPHVDIHAFGVAGLEGPRREVIAALERVWAACDLQVVWATAGDRDHVALFAHPSGDEDLVRCPACGHAAARPWARTGWQEPPDEPELAPVEIETPDCDTIAALAEFLDIPASKTLKMVFYSVEGKVTCVVIRGDRAVDESKLARVLGSRQYYASLEDELRSAGTVGGYASPIGLDRSHVRVVADPSVRSGRNFVSGANRPGYHINNVNIPRDFAPDEWADLALIEQGDGCPECGEVLDITAAFSLAHCVAPAPCNPEAEYLDQEGRGQPLWLASWHVDLARLLAAVVEDHHDDYGLIWPAPCAPFDVHLVVLDTRREAVAAQARALYEQLRAGGYSVLCDDRNASAGVKFNDADLIGIPLRLTVSKRSVKEDFVEAKWRDAKERLRVDEEGLFAVLAKLR
jgi:prolyl-tRNA synthetase